MASGPKKKQKPRVSGISFVLQTEAEDLFRISDKVPTTWFGRLWRSLLIAYFR